MNKLKDFYHKVVLGTFKSLRFSFQTFKLINMVFYFLSTHQFGSYYRILTKFLIKLVTYYYVIPILKRYYHLNTTHVLLNKTILSLFRASHLESHQREHIALLSKIRELYFVSWAPPLKLKKDHID